MNDLPFVPDPTCNCLACQLARYRQSHSPQPGPSPKPVPKPLTPVRPLAPDPNVLPLPWQLAVEACTAKLGMPKRSAENLAQALALQYPLATEGEALRLMFSRN